MSTNSDKTRIRSADELFQRGAQFLEICALLDKHNVTYFIQGGVLLGAVRENYFIKWDWDVEISVFSVEFRPVFENVVADLVKHGYSVLKTDQAIERLKIDFYKGPSPEATTFTIFGWYHDSRSSSYRRKALRIPEHYLNPLSSITFLGRTVLCPNSVEDYLTFQYGDWKKPMRTADKSSYLSESFSGMQTQLKDEKPKRLKILASKILKKLTSMKKR